MTTVPLATAEMASLVGSRIRTENETGGECLCLFLVLGLAPSPPRLITFGDGGRSGLRAEPGPAVLASAVLVWIARDNRETTHSP